MKCQILFSGKKKDKKNIVNLSSAEFVQSLEKASKGTP